jgi:S-adenosylmethionine hydrolase
VFISGSNSMTQRPIITLLTDFGTIDPFIGQMKGVIAMRCPRANVVDLTHAIEPQNVKQAGYVLADSWRFFQPGTIHVAVIDPGVGSARRIIAAAVDDQIMIAPDNGLLTAVFADTPPREVRVLENPDLFLKSVSNTFHGRDKFAPAAGLLAAGLRYEEAGATIDDWQTLDLPQPVVNDDGSVRGEVILVDRFGNAITNIRGPQLPMMPVIEIGQTQIEGLKRAYSEAEEGEPLAIISSGGRLEIAVNQGSAVERFGVSIGAAITASPTLN